MLDLQLDRDTGVYMAPLQLKANNGVLVIDDFGRQAMTPDALLNRWIVPLDRGVDYLTLHGRKIEVPFEVKAVLSTNLQPSDLGDEAFFRRIHNKVYIGACTDDQFDWILVRVAERKRLEVDATTAARLRQVAKARGDGELRAYLPGVDLPARGRRDLLREPRSPADPGAGRPGARPVLHPHGRQPAPTDGAGRPPEPVLLRRIERRRAAPPPEMRTRAGLTSAGHAERALRIGSCAVGAVLLPSGGCPGGLDRPAAARGNGASGCGRRGGNDRRATVTPRRPVIAA